LDPKKVEEVADKAIGYLSGAGVSGLVYLGDRLGLYRALSESDPSTRPLRIGPAVAFPTTIPAQIMP
jgi:hypothetical protein